MWLSRCGHSHTTQVQLENIARHCKESQYIRSDDNLSTVEEIQSEISQHFLFLFFFTPFSFSPLFSFPYLYLSFYPSFFLICLIFPGLPFSLSLFFCPSFLLSYPFLFLSLPFLYLSIHLSAFFIHWFVSCSFSSLFSIFLSFSIVLSIYFSLVYLSFSVPQFSLFIYLSIHPSIFFFLFS